MRYRHMRKYIIYSGKCCGGMNSPAYPDPEDGHNDVLWMLWVHPVQSILITLFLMYGWRIRATVSTGWSECVFLVLLLPSEASASTSRQAKVNQRAWGNEGRVPTEVKQTSSPACISEANVFQNVPQKMGVKHIAWLQMRVANRELILFDMHN